MMAFACVSFFDFPSNLAKADSEKEIKEDIKDYEKKLQEAQQTLTNLQAQSYRNKSQINATQSLIQTLHSDILRREAELKNLSERMDLNKVMLAEYVRQMYYANQDHPVISLAIFEGSLSDWAKDFDNFAGLKSKISNVLEEIEIAKGENEEAKALLADQKEEKQDVLETQQAQQEQIAGNVQEAQLTVAQIQQKISKLRSTLSSFLGKSFDMDDVVDAVKLAEKKTGVRKEFLFAMLDKETDLGRFTGGCTYSNTRVKPADKEVFKDICEELGYDYKKKKISCAGSGGYGGAMGVAQFMPTTWRSSSCYSGGYGSKIASITGNDPADPWDLEDGVIGMALKLKCAGADKKSKERSAAMIYYCGSDHPKETYPGRIASCNNYANTVISWSKGYDEYFK